MLEFEVHQFQNIKLGIHIAQAVLIFVSWAITIAVFKAKDSIIDGRAGWYFALCFLTVPAIIYLTMTPRFPRTRKFANPYAMAAVDGFFAILWLSAFAAVANWNSTGKCAEGCNLSKAVVGLGVLIWLFFVLSTFMSLYAVFYYKREGYLPGASRAPGNAQLIDPDKDAFSTAPHDDEYVAVHNTEEHELGSHSLNAEPFDVQGRHDTPMYGEGGYMQPTVEETGYTGYQGRQSPHVEETGYTGYQGRQSPQVEDTGYPGYQGAGQGPQVGQDERMHFPNARYDNV